MPIGPIGSKRGGEGLHCFNANLYNFRDLTLQTVMRCKHRGAELIAVPEPDAGEWVICCLQCGAKNLFEVGLQSVAWRF